MSSSGLQKWALVGALFAATHTHANETRQVVSSNGTTNIVERIDFPVGDIKDIVPAGDKYIIHANPIDSLKDSVAQDALFVMEKANPNAAFGRTFSKEINSVAYVPGLDIAVWSYKDDWNDNDILELRKGENALRAAGANKQFQWDDFLNTIYPESLIFSSDTNTIRGISYDEDVARSFEMSEGDYLMRGNSDPFYTSSASRVASGNHKDVFVIPDSDMPSVIRRYTFLPSVINYSMPQMCSHTKVTAMSNTSDASSDNGYLLLGTQNGHVMGFLHGAANNSDQLNVVSDQTIWNNIPISSIASGQDSCENGRIVSTATNEVVEIKPSTVSACDRIIPSDQETGYRRVVADQDSTLLLSNTHSNCFYRIRKSR